MRCEISWSDEEAHVQVKTPYIAEYVEDLKNTIPPPYRKWNADKGVWEVHTDYYEVLMDVIHRYFAEDKVIRYL
jgi:1,2-phenylacetyl-CoA epoxidase catalytic subunit